jgi:ABC-type amino acid transport substrate-binding protein
MRSAARTASILLATCLSCLTAAVQAQEATSGTLKAIKDRKAVVIGYVVDAYPMSFKGKDGQAQGYSVDLCRRIAEEAGKAIGVPQIDVKYVPVTLEERFDAVAGGKVDIECATSTITLSRMKKVDFTHMTFLDGGSLLVRKNAAIHGIASLVDETVAVIPGTTTERALKEALTRTHVNAKVVLVKDHGEGMAALEAGKVSAYASDRVILIGLLVKAANRDSFDLASEQFSMEPYGFMVRRNDADFRLVANSTLSQLYRSGEVLKIFDRWFGEVGKPTPALIGMYLMHATPE